MCKLRGSVSRASTFTGTFLKTGEDWAHAQYITPVPHPRGTKGEFEIRVSAKLFVMAQLPPIISISSVFQGRRRLSLC